MAETLHVRGRNTGTCRIDINFSGFCCESCFSEDCFEVGQVFQGVTEDHPMCAPENEMMSARRVFIILWSTAGAPTNHHLELIFPQWCHKHCLLAGVFCHWNLKSKVEMNEHFQEIIDAGHWIWILHCYLVETAVRNLSGLSFLGTNTIGAAQGLCEGSMIPVVLLNNLMSGFW